jgi:D-amino-acid dehydrogenase
MSTDVVVVGGGVVGAACAYYLSEAGAQVTVIEQREFGRGCSHGNCGYVSPSHILPLCQPGAITRVLKTMFQRNSPVYLKPRLSWQLWSWLWRFAKRCNQADMLEAGKARQALLDSSRRLYSGLFDSATLTECDWETIGLLFVFLTEPAFEHYAEVDELLRKEFGLGATPYIRDGLQQLEPALKPNVHGAWLYECDAHLKSDKLMAAWRRALQLRNVDIREHCTLERLEKSGNRVSGLVTSQGRLTSNQVVIATGAWTPLLQSELGCQIPIQPGKGYSITMPRPERCPKYPMIFEEHRVAVTPMQETFRIGSTMEFAGYDDRLNRNRLSILTEGAKHYLYTPSAEPRYEEWWGWRPMSCDGKPLIGQPPRLNNTWLATGHSMLGVSMATATGKLVTELLTGQTPHVDPHPYRIDRF